MIQTQTNNKMNQPKKVQKVMTQPINLIFRFLQNQSRVQIWLYEQVNMRIEGKIIGFDEYMNLTLDEAEELLNGNQKTAQSTLQKVDEDLDFLRDQITTTEVNMARLHNWAVKQKQQIKK